MKKPLIVFGVAFGLSILFTLLPLLFRAVTSLSFSSSTDAEFLSINTAISLFFDLAGPAVFFVVFYFLAKNIKIQAVKSAIIAVLLGATLGTAFLYLLNIFLYRSYLGIYLELAASSVVPSVFQFFFPALTALLFVEL